MFFLASFTLVFFIELGVYGLFHCTSIRFINSVSEKNNDVNTNRLSQIYSNAARWFYVMEVKIQK